MSDERLEEDTMLNSIEIEVEEDENEEVIETDAHINESEESEEEHIFTLSEWFVKHINKLIVIIAMALTVIILIYITISVYQRLGKPNESQQTGIGILEWRD